MKMVDVVELFKDELNLNITPGGKFEYIDGVKKAVDSKRIDNLSWTDYRDDNMGRLFLKHDYLVVDIDGSFSHETENTLELTTGISLPITFYTVTSNPSKIHAYYKYPKHLKLPNRTKSKVAPSIDTFTYGTIFEGHPSGHYAINAHDIGELPDNHLFIQTLLELPSNYFTSTSEIYPLSNPPLYNAVEQYMKPNFLALRKGQRNKVIKLLLPKAYHPSKGEHPDLIHLPVSYSLINDMATKLSSVAELSTEALREFLVTYIERHGLDPDFNNSQLDNLILGTLPSRNAIELPNVNDALSIQEMMDGQKSQTPIFKCSLPGAKASLGYIRMSKLTMEPVAFNDHYFLDKSLTSSLNPERNIYREDGQIAGWDDNVPLVEVVNDPYEPTIFYRDEFPVINIALRSDYLKMAAPIQSQYIDDNIFMKLFRSVIPNEYLDYVLHYYHTVIWAQTPPITVMWMATGKNVQGGTGKSLITLTIFSMILLSAGDRITVTQLVKGWGDTILGKRLSSLEDMEELGKQEWEKAHAAIKQLFSASYSTVDMKYGSISSQIIRTALTGSSNSIPKLEEHDRRFFCLQPAQLDSDLPNEPLSDEDADHLDDIVKSRQYSEELQEFVNYLYYMHQQPMPPEIKTGLYVRAPITKYRQRWIVDHKTHSGRIISLMNSPKDLMEIVNFKHDDAYHNDFVDLLIYIVAVHRSDTGKVALSWEWFRYFLVFVSSADNILHTSKASVASALELEDGFAANTGLYKVYPVPDTVAPRLRNMKDSGLLIPISPQSIEEYKDIIEEEMKEV